MGRLWYWVLAVCVVMQGGAALAETTEERIQKLEKAIEELQKHEAVEREVVGQPPGVAPGEAKNIQQLGQEGQGAERKYGSIMQGSGKLIYARPFVAQPKAIVGGYTDVEYFNRKRDGNPATIDTHRFVPFIYADVSEHVKFAAELEIEHGGRSTVPDKGMEIGVEFMTVDYLITDPLNLRGGLILMPLGKFNLLHDAPLRDLTERPLVDQFIIPAALRQTGAGFYGTVYPTRRSKLDYEIYAVSGFTGFTGTTSPINGEKGVRSARQGGVDDNNAGKAVVGRVAFSPILGIEVGGSGFHGSYDPSQGRKLSIYAVDWTLVRGPFELIGEAAWAHAEDNNLTLAGTPSGLPDRMWGYYVQLNYHFLPQWLTNLAPSHFRQEVSTFTAVARWEETDLFQGRDGNFTNAREFQRLTLGLNFRPTEDTVLKFDYQYSPKAIVNHGGSRPGHDQAIVASVATYF